MHTFWRHAHQVLYPTEGSPVAAAIMSCGLISKVAYGWKIVGLVYRHAVSLWRNSVDFVDIRSRYLFWRLAFIVKSGFNYSDTTWAPWHFRTKTTHNKRPKLCITNPVWGGLQSSVGFPQKGPLMRKTFPCYAGESVWNQGRISNTMYRNLCWIP